MKVIRQKQCPICLDWFSAKGLTSHMRIVHGGVKTCQEEPKGYVQRFCDFIWNFNPVYSCCCCCWIMVILIILIFSWHIVSKVLAFAVRFLVQVGLVEQGMKPIVGSIAGWWTAGV